MREWLGTTGRNNESQMERSRKREDHLPGCNPKQSLPDPRIRLLGDPHLQSHEFSNSGGLPGGLGGGALLAGARLLARGRLEPESLLHLAGGRGGKRPLQRGRRRGGGGRGGGEGGRWGRPIGLGDVGEWLGAGCTACGNEDLVGGLAEIGVREGDAEGAEGGGEVGGGGRHGDRGGGRGGEAEGGGAVGVPEARSAEEMRHHRPTTGKLFSLFAAADVVALWLLSLSALGWRCRII